MTEQEAIKHAREYIKYVNHSGWEKDFDAIDKLIVATEELQQIRETIKDFALDCGSAISDVKEMYRQLNEYLKIGTVEELKEAKEKQIAKKPRFVDVRFRNHGRNIGDGCSLDKCYECPSCRSHIFHVWDSENYCEKCGQKLDWGNEDAE